MQIGYDPDFIGDGIKIPLPTFDKSLGQSVLRKASLRDKQFSDHIHFTLVMNEHNRQLIYSAYNIDQKLYIKKAKGKGEKSWSKDKKIGAVNQLGNEYYADREDSTGKKIPNPYDRGHMVMRFNNMWGAADSEADKAGKATFIYANSSLQHENLNRDEWKELELNIVHDLQHDSNDRLAVFTGPIFGDLDRHVVLSDQNKARVPSGFFKVICFRNKHAKSAAEKLGVLTFAIFQDDQILRDKKGAATVKTDRRYQITVTELQKLTGIKFPAKVRSQNPLLFYDKWVRVRKDIDSVPERIPINDVSDRVGTIAEPRCKMTPLNERRIVINSAMINPSGKESRNEWVSLHNRGDRKVNLKKWTLVDGHGRKAELTGSIEAGESIKLRGDARGKLKLANTGGSLMLFDNHSCVVDHATWSAPQIKRVPEGVAFMFEHGQ